MKKRDAEQFLNVLSRRNFSLRPPQPLLGLRWAVVPDLRHSATLPVLPLSRTPKMHWNRS